MSVRTTALAMVLFPIVVTPMPGQVRDQALFARAVDSIAALAIKSGSAAGIAVAVARGSNVILTKGYGFADLENLVPVTDSTVFRIGSITKQFTAAIVLQLVGEDRLSLDDTLGKFIPQFPAGGNRVLVRHLLNHTSGIKSYTGLGPRFWQRARLPMPLDTLIALLQGLPPDFKPGEQWSYNNSGYYLLGSIIERVTGKSYAANIEERISRPLGLTATRYCGTAPLITHRAQGYATSPDGLMNAEYLDMSGPGAAGALCSSVSDLLRWHAALTTGRVIPLSTYALMSAPDTLNSGERLTYGYGLGVGKLGDHPRVGHGGGINGFATHLAWFPQDSTTIVVLVNTEGPVADQLLASIGGLALGVPAVQVTLRVRVPEGMGPVYLAGSLPELGNWRPDGLVLEGRGRERTAQVRAVPGTIFEYKFTAGSWTREALSPAGTVPPNHRLLIDRDTVVVHEIVAFNQPE